MPKDFNSLFKLVEEEKRLFKQMSGASSNFNYTPNNMSTILSPKYQIEKNRNKPIQVKDSSMQQFEMMPSNQEFNLPSIKQQPIYEFDEDDKKINLGSFKSNKKIGHLPSSI